MLYKQKKCKSDLDCNDCVIEKYCVDGFCSQNCLNVSVGHNWTSDVDCNPSCALWPDMKYCVDKKCSLAYKSNPEQTKNKDYTFVYELVGMFLVAILMNLLFNNLRSTFRKNHTNPS
jgi:hypothetical protein